MTTVPLLFFGAAARQLRLSTMGILQYLSPTLQFLLAVVAFREPFSTAQIVSFGVHLDGNRHLHGRFVRAVRQDRLALVEPLGRTREKAVGREATSDKPPCRLARRWWPRFSQRLGPGGRRGRSGVCREGPQRVVWAAARRLGLPRTYGPDCVRSNAGREVRSESARSGDSRGALRSCTNWTFSPACLISRKPVKSGASKVPPCCIFSCHSVQYECHTVTHGPETQGPVVKRLGVIT